MGGAPVTGTGPGWLWWDETPRQCAMVKISGAVRPLLLLSPLCHRLFLLPMEMIILLTRSLLLLGFAFLLAERFLQFS